MIVSSSHTSWKAHYNSIWPDQIDEKASWFRKYFVGKQYVTFIGPIMDDENDLSVISIVKEYEKESKQKPILQYRIIVRTKQVKVKIYLLPSPPICIYFFLFCRISI